MSDRYRDVSQLIIKSDKKKSSQNSNYKIFPWMEKTIIKTFDL